MQIRKKKKNASTKVSTAEYKKKTFIIMIIPERKKQQSFYTNFLPINQSINESCTKYWFCRSDDYDNDFLMILLLTIINESSTTEKVIFIFYNIFHDRFS